MAETKNDVPNLPKEIIVDINGNECKFPCNITWTVSEAIKEIRDRYGLRYGGLQDDTGALSYTTIISKTEGKIYFIGGQPIQQQGKNKYNLIHNTIINHSKKDLSSFPLLCFS